MGKLWIACGALLAALAVMAGAFGAHILKGRLSPDELANFEVAVRYQMYHALGLAIVGLLPRRGAAATLAGGAFLVGELLFCGGLYAWLFTPLRGIVHVVPLGGGAFILGWLALAYVAASLPSSADRSE